jgi:hypothetical protein
MKKICLFTTFSLEIIISGLEEIIWSLRIHGPVQMTHPGTLQVGVISFEDIQIMITIMKTFLVLLKIGHGMTIQAKKDKNHIW